MGRERGHPGRPGRRGPGALAQHRAHLGERGERGRAAVVRARRGGLVRAGDFEANSRLEAALGYGVGAPHGPGLVTPYAGFALSDGAHRALRTGVRWNASQSAAVSLEASREGQGSGEAPTNALALRAEVRW